MIKKTCPELLLRSRKKVCLSSCSDFRVDKADCSLFRCAILQFCNGDSDYDHTHSFRRISINGVSICYYYHVRGSVSLCSSYRRPDYVGE